MRSLLTSLFIIASLSVKAQSGLQWVMSAQAGTSTHSTTNYQGSLLFGFITERNQQISVGPVMKGFLFAGHQQTNIGARIYSQSALIGPLGLFLQCDVFNMNMSPAQYTPEKKMKLDAGMGFAFNFNNHIGLTAGYNFGEFNPAQGSTKGVGNLRVLYNLPLVRQ